MPKKKTTKEINNGWREYKADDVVFPYADCFYQKCFYKANSLSKICAEIVEYSHPVVTDIRKLKAWELHIHIPDDMSIVGIATNTNSYSYTKLDFKKMEKDARKIIKALYV